MEFLGMSAHAGTMSEIHGAGCISATIMNALASDEVASKDLMH